MINIELRKNLPEHSIVFDNCSFDNSIVGITENDQVVYSFEKMIEELQTDEGWSEIDSIEWIETNTLRALQYIGSNYAPIIIYNIN